MKGEQLASLTNYLGDTRALLESMCSPALLSPQSNATASARGNGGLTGVFTFVLVLAYLYLSSDAKEAKRE